MTQSNSHLSTPDIPLPAMAIKELTGPRKTTTIRLYSEAFGDKGPVCRACVPGCCGSCAIAEGFFEESAYKLVGRLWYRKIRTPLQEEKALVAHAKTMFDEAKRKYKFGKSGFLTPGKGCRIPVEERSLVCISFCCNNLGDQARKTAIEMLGGFIQSASYRLKLGRRKPPQAV